MSRAAPTDASVAVDVAAAAQLACLLEVSAPKPGNVAQGRHFADARYEDFLASAAAIGSSLAQAGSRPIGATVRFAVEATAQWTRSNTNLGIVLLLTPLARAALVASSAGEPAAEAGGADPSGWPRLRRRLRRVLEETGVPDARDVYAAIRRAAPGGLGRASVEDVAGEPSVPLLEAMRLASDRDGVAREYATTFETTFDVGVPALVRARGEGLSWDDAVVETFLILLAASPDTQIARRRGAPPAADVSRRAGAVLAAGGVRTAAGRRALDEMDRALRGGQDTMNPGTTADLTAAAIFVVLLGGGWHAAHGGLNAAAR